MERIARASLPALTTKTAQKTIHPNNTLVADWDIAHEIQHNLGAYNFRITIKHVKGHQDVDTPYNKLPLLAQLNVDADELASQFMREHPRITSRVPGLTHNMCQLKLPKGSINSRYKNTIRTATLCGDLWE